MIDGILQGVSEPPVRRLRARALLGAICACAAAVTIFLGSRLTFFNDDWFYLFQHHSILSPVNGQPVVLLAPSYHVLVALFGVESQLPFRAVLATALCGLAVVVFVFARERAGVMLALAASTLLLFLGPAWEALLFFASLNFIGALVAGIAALILLELDTSRRNLAASALLIVSISWSSLGIAFLVAVVIAIALRRRVRQLWIPGAPALLFAVWWVLSGRDGPSYVSSSNLIHLPKYVLDSLARGLTTLAGLNHGTSASHYGRGYALILLVAFGIGTWWYRGGRPRAWSFVLIGLALSFWLLAGANYFPGREPSASRYQFIDATFLLLIALELFRPLRLAPRARVVVLGLALLVVCSNLVGLRSGYQFLRAQSDLARADLGALTLTRDRVAPDFQLSQRVAGTPYLASIFAGSYFQVTAKHGAPKVFSPTQIATAPPALRSAADHVLVAADAPRPSITSNQKPSSPRDRCRTGSEAHDVGFRSTRVVVTNLGPQVEVVGLRRFASAGSLVPVAFLPPGRTLRLRVPADGSARPWHIGGLGRQPLRICL